MPALKSRNYPLFLVFFCFRVQANRWRKRGISVVPLKYGVGWDGRSYTAMVSIFHTHGTVAIAHGGIDIGQGINTKVLTSLEYDYSQTSIKRSPSGNGQLTA